MKSRLSLQELIDCGLLSIMIIFPLSVNVAFSSLNDFQHPLIAINISLASLLIGIIFLLWILKIAIAKEWSKIKLLPLPILIFFIIEILSFVNAFSLSEWIKEIVQTIVYLILFYILLLNNLKTFNLKTFKNVLFILTTLILILSFIQHSILKGDVYLIKGLFENRNILGIYLCMMMPFIYAELLSTTYILRRLWMTLLLILSIIVITSGSAILSLIISLIVVSFYHSKKVLYRFLFTLLVIGILYPFIMPQKNITAVKEFASIYEQGSISQNYYRRLLLLTNSEDQKILLNKELNGKFLRIKTTDLLSAKLPAPNIGDRYKDIDSIKHIMNRYVEVQAALNLMAENVLLGIGLGNFQNEIGVYYKELPKINTSEPYQTNTYLLLGATIGLLGLSAFLWVLLHSLNNSIFKFRNTNGEKKYFYLGLFGAILSIIIEGFFSYILVSILMVPFVFILFLSNKEIDL